MQSDFVFEDARMNVELVVVQRTALRLDTQSDQRTGRGIFRSGVTGSMSRVMRSIFLAKNFGTGPQDTRTREEVINKMDGEAFTEDELMLLLSIADEIAFAIRNARIFEYVVDGYCLQRQGLATCRGCKRPLGSWTPCVKYREELV